MNHEPFSKAVLACDTDTGGMLCLLYLPHHGSLAPATFSLIAYCFFPFPW